MSPLVAQGEAELALGRAEPALAAFEAARLESPEHPRVLLGLVRAHQLAGDLEAAQRFLDTEELADRGRDPEIARLRRDVGFALGSARLAGGDPAGALAAWEALTPPHPAGLAVARAEALMRRGAAAEGRGEIQAALADYAAAFASDPEREDAVAAGAALLLSEGRADEAIALLREGLRRQPHGERLQALMLEALGLEPRPEADRPRD
ncbi:MAG: tetratricopeptide repeat protein [Proteobacteria bacterium]|nr:tetratricopeptide repeat protein [Pseudomonadota bacterium]